MFDYLKYIYNYYFNYSLYIAQDTVEKNNQVINNEESTGQKSLLLKKNDGYKNINTNKALDVLFDPTDMFI